MVRNESFLEAYMAVFVFDSLLDMPKIFLEALSDSLTFIIGSTTTRPPETALVKKSVHSFDGTDRDLGYRHIGSRSGPMRVVIYGWPKTAPLKRIAKQPRSLKLYILCLSVWF